MAKAVGDTTVGPAHDDIGLDTPAAELGDGVLGRLGLLLPRRTDVGNEGDVDVAHVLATDVEPELADGLEERQDLDVTDRAADLGDHDIDLVVGQIRRSAA